jgi:hypothetical protein
MGTHARIAAMGRDYPYGIAVASSGAAFYTRAMRT